jgi:hypothetical protein
MVYDHDKCHDDVYVLGGTIVTMPSFCPGSMYMNYDSTNKSVIKKCILKFIFIFLPHRKTALLKKTKKMFRM